MWKDKKPVLFISIHELPIQEFVSIPIVVVVQTSLVLLEYVTFMWGVDVAN